MKYPPTLELVPIGDEPLPDAVLHALRDFLTSFLAGPVRLGDPLALRGPATAGDRQPSGSVVDALIARSGPDPDPRERWFLAVTSRDLSAPGRTFVFGEATVGGAWAVVSTARLLDPGDHSEESLRRLFIEALHELGHVAGLPHCDRPTCAMSPSANPGDVDRKNPAFCVPCHERFFSTNHLDRPDRER